MTRATSFPSPSAFPPNPQPRVVLCDNLRSAVLERRGNEIHFNPRLMELCAHYHFVARPCQVRADNQKGRVEHVERAIRYVRESFWAGGSFTTLAECNRQALLWRDQVAHRRGWPGGDSKRGPKDPLGGVYHRVTQKGPDWLRPFLHWK